VARLEDRLRRLEARGEGPPQRSEAERRSYWEARQKISRNEQTPPDVKHARSMIALFRLQGYLSKWTAAELIEAVVSRPHDAAGVGSEVEGRSLSLIESEVWRAVHDGGPDVEHLAGELPPEWADALAAADEWRERLTSMPIADLARWQVEHGALVERGASTDEIIEHAAERMGPFGISEELMERVMGPDVAENSPKEGAWLIYAPVADALCSEWAWQVVEHVRKLKQTQTTGGK
jgi:hypothetical protein